MKTLVLLVFASVVLVEAHGCCPHGWTQISGRCFLYVPSRHIWAVAETVCLSKGANLASVHSSDEYLDIQRMIWKITHAYDRTWLGGSDCQHEGIWLWSDGTPFKYRHSGRLDDKWGKQNCLQMNYGSDKSWDDVRCSRRLPFVCAKRIMRNCP